MLPSGGASGPWPWLLELNRFPALGLRSASDEGTKLQVDGLPGVSLIDLNLLATPKKGLKYDEISLNDVDSHLKIHSRNLRIFYL